MIGERTRILQDPMVPISKDLVATHVTRVTRVNSLVRVRSDAAILLCYNKSIATVDSNEWRADSYFNRHTLPVPPPRITRSNSSGSVFQGKWVAKLFSMVMRLFPSGQLAHFWRALI